MSKPWKKVSSLPPNETSLVDDIIKYINENITDRLQISIIAAHFYLSDAYVCRAFKAQTGTTINKYITARRITIAKQYLAKGSTVLNACEKSGFRDYTNFVKAFTKLVGISPKKYEKLHAQERVLKKRDEIRLCRGRCVFAASKPFYCPGFASWAAGNGACEKYRPVPGTVGGGQRCIWSGGPTPPGKPWDLIAVEKGTG